MKENYGSVGSTAITRTSPTKFTEWSGHSETLEEMVLYEALYPNDLGRDVGSTARTVLSDVEVDGVTKPRFADD